ncbi:MAG: hypothetical protein JO131_03335 [Gammaproteobacteria bacterium]|nr:hypothetical protein [Gammaproteobacteria bacterium]
MPEGSLIFQLPYVPFPENPPIELMKDYDQFRPYLHSHHLLWSYGALKGRPVASWIERLSSLPIPEMLKHISYAGYTGLYVNLNGYPDHGMAITKQITTILKIRPLFNTNNDIVFYDLRPYINQLKDIQKFSIRNKNILEEKPQKFSTIWNYGFYSLEKNNDISWHWSKNKSQLTFINFDDRPIKIQLTFTVATGNKSSSSLIIKSSSSIDHIQINSEEKIITKIITLAIGQNKFYFYTNAARVNAPNDPRQLYFILKNLTVKQI